eukprot:scaffold8733_cov52-Attheya_sp.AAC.2
MRATYGGWQPRGRLCSSLFDPVILNHIEWVGDSLIIYFTCTKVDQEGLNCNEPWHIYANPVHNQYDRFSNFLGELLKKNEATFVAMGVSIKDIATHSIRSKGAASFWTSGCTISPSFVSVCFSRAGLLMGNVKDRYFHFASAGDQFVGRCASGLPLSSLDFAISLPYFDTGGGEELETKIQALVDSICHAECPIGKKFLIRCSSPDESIIASAVTKHPRNKTDETPELTGMLEHVTLIKCEIAKLTLHHKNLSEEIATRICK